MLFGRFVLRHLARDRGQAVILVAPFIFLFSVFGVAVIDFGDLYALKRDTQTDADFAALAGAVELPDFDDNAGAVAAATAAATAWALANDVTLSDLTVEVIDTCFSAKDDVHTGVRVTVERTPETFLLDIFGVTPTVRATGVACSGSPTNMFGFLPWAVATDGPCFTNEANPEDRSPILGARCSVSVGGQESEQGSVSQLGMTPGGACTDGNSDADVYEVNIITGVPIDCAIGDSVTSNPGVNVGKTYQGLQTRIGSEGACTAAAASFFPSVQSDTANFNAHPSITGLIAPTKGPSGGGVDDFFEVFRPGLNYDLLDPGRNLTTFDCDASTVGTETSPRNVVVLVINDVGTSDGVGCTGGAGQSKCYEIRGFMRIYIEGCTTKSGFSAACNSGGSGKSFTVHARIVESVGLSEGVLGLTRYGEYQAFLRE